MKQIKTIAIVGGGTLSKQFLSEIIKSDYIIGVDRGAFWLIDHNVLPDISIGDFDSVTAEELRMIKQKCQHIEKHPKKKNETDMEIAVKHAMGMHPKEVKIYGAVGDRLDHTLVNVQLLERLHGKAITGVIRDEHNEVRMVDSLFIMKKENRFRYVSILPVTETVEISLTGFVYNLSRVLIRRGQTLGVSNEIREDEATIDVCKGKAIIIRSRD